MTHSYGETPPTPQESMRETEAMTALADELVRWFETAAMGEPFQFATSDYPVLERALRVAAAPAIGEKALRSVVDFVGKLKADEIDDDLLYGLLELETQCRRAIFTPSVPSNVLLEAATRLRDLLTSDGDPPSLLIPSEIDDANAFTQAFDDLANAIRSLPERS